MRGEGRVTQIHQEKKRAPENAGELQRESARVREISGERCKGEREREWEIERERAWERERARGRAKVRARARGK